MADENTPRALGYVCIDLVHTIHDLDLQARRMARRLGYHYAGLIKSSSLIVPEALLDHVTTHRIELLIVPDLGHLRDRIPAELAELTDIHNLATGQTYERGDGYAPDEGNPLQGDSEDEVHLRKPPRNES